MSTLAAPNDPRYVELAYAQALVVAVVFVLFWLFRLGFLANAIYLPIVLPLLLAGVIVDAAAIALSPFLEMLVPLGIGLFLKARYDEAASSLLYPETQVSNIGLALLIVLVLGLFGSGAILAVVSVTVVALIAGYLLGGPGTDTWRVLALGTRQRNMAASFVIATGNFSAQPEVLVFLAAAGLIRMIIIMPIAAEFGKCAKAAAAEAVAPGGRAAPVRR